MKWYVLFILVVGLAMVEIVQAQSNQDVKIFNFPGATDTSTDAIGINDRGMIVGQASGNPGFGESGEDDSTIGFVYDGTSFYKIVIPGYDVITAAGINNQGLITGLVETKDQNRIRSGYVVHFRSNNVVKVE
jgi:hypothetical protein